MPIIVCAIVIGLLAGAATAPALAAPAVSALGEWSPASDSLTRFTVMIGSPTGVDRVRSEDGFLAGGWFIQGRFAGVVRTTPADSSHWTTLGRVLRLSLVSEDVMHAEFADELDGVASFRDTRTRLLAPRPLDPQDRYAIGLPRFDEAVQVEQPALAIRRVSPRYPDAAREKGIDGTVIVHVLVDTEGIVRDTRVTHSIPELDEASVLAVRQWRFTPAMWRGRPVAAWLEIPVKFSLN